jgi:hypothetical protein
MGDLGLVRNTKSTAAGLSPDFTAPTGRICSPVALFIGVFN